MSKRHRAIEVFIAAQGSFWGTAWVCSTIPHMGLGQEYLIGSAFAASTSIGTYLRWLAE